MTNPFRFKQFEIRQDRGAMKVGTDGVLLGAWATGNKPQRILDIGTGTGLIALMLAQRYTEAHITGIDIDDIACHQANENVAAAPFFSRVTILRQSLQSHQPANPYDLIVSNPPFFSNSTKAPDQSRAMARHDHSLPLAELILHTSRLLAPSGSCGFVVPYDKLTSLLELAQLQHLFPERICKVFPSKDPPPKRALVQFGSQNRDPEETTLVIEKARHLYSSEYIQLTREFYLNM